MKKTVCIWVILLLTAAIISMGCATIVHGNDQEISIKSKPSGAKATIYDRYDREVWSSETPCTARLQRGDGFFVKQTYRIVFEKEGYDAKTFQLYSSVDGWYIAGNLFLGGFIGWLVIDPASGAMWRIDPDIVNVSLDKSVALLSDEQGFAIAMREDIPDQVFAMSNPQKVN